ncbi:MAG: DUF2959 domain-containing protein [Lentisphaerales bacterium]|nr:DUF2959 domain-containing protein [Lentisphaerales bacterium]
MKLFYLTAITLFLTSCSQVYYSTWEMLGKEKRHLLIGHVEDFSEEQAETAEVFESVVERIQSEYSLDGGELETTYKKIKADYDECEGRHKDLLARIDKVDSIAEDLFEEWVSEISEISNAKLRQQSQSSQKESHTKFQRLSQAMHKSATKIPPILTKLKDNMLFLKHNLNAKAVGSLGKEMASIQEDIQILIKDMKASISEAEAFIKSFK